MSKADAARRPEFSRLNGWLYYRVPGMDCAAEEAEIRRAVENVENIRGLRFHLAQRTLAMDGPDAAIDNAVAAIRQAGFEPELLTRARGNPVAEAQSHGAHSSMQGLWRLALALVFASGAEVIAWSAADSLLMEGGGLAMAAIAILLAGFEVYQKGLRALRLGRLNINALMSVAVTGAFLIGEWPEAAMVMALYAIAEVIEARAVDRARNAIQGLLAMAPEEASLRQPDGSWLTVPVTAVGLDAVVRVRPGERIPMDGVISNGTTSINQAPVTGESIPVDKTIGDPVFAGTINESGSFEFTVTALASNSTLARIIHAVEAAQSTRAPTQSFVGRFAAIYTPAVFVIALVLAVFGAWLPGWTVMEAVYKALVLLVIACPCALVISTPVTIISGLATAARRGILIKGGIHLENARHLRAIALDKTGTITEGKPVLVEWEPWGTTDRGLAEAIAAALAGHSDHPVSRAIAQGLPASALEILTFKALPGRGVEAQVNGTSYVLGNHRLIEDRGQCGPELETRLKAHEESGRTVTLLASDVGVLALFAVADTIKESSREAITLLKKLGITPIMLTGDNQATAAVIAHQAGVDEARGNLLPEDKLLAIKAMQKKFGMTAMTGDGINDAPALAQSDIGVAMGAAGTDTAMEAADIVVMNDDLRRIAETVMLSRFTHQVLLQNITLSLAIKAAFLVLAIFGSASMWMAVFADMGASLLVVANGLRLLRYLGNPSKTHRAQQ